MSKVYVVLDEVVSLDSSCTTYVKGVYTKKEKAHAHVEKLQERFPFNKIEQHFPYWEEHELLKT